MSAPGTGDTCKLPYHRGSLSRGEYSYSYDAIGGHSWAIPYGTGILALGWQINPSLTGTRMITLMRETAYENAAGDLFIDPSAFIDAVRSTL